MPGLLGPIRAQLAQFRDRFAHVGTAFSDSQAPSRARTFRYAPFGTMSSSLTLQGDATNAHVHAVPALSAGPRPGRQPRRMRGAADRLKRFRAASRHAE